MAPGRNISHFHHRFSDTKYHWNPFKSTGRSEQVLDYNIWLHQFNYNWIWRDIDRQSWRFCYKKKRMAPGRNISYFRHRFSGTKYYWNSSKLTGHWEQVSDLNLWWYQQNYNWIWRDTHRQSRRVSRVGVSAAAHFRLLPPHFTRQIFSKPFKNNNNHHNKPELSPGPSFHRVGHSQNGFHSGRKRRGRHQRHLSGIEFPNCRSPGDREIKKANETVT